MRRYFAAHAIERSSVHLETSIIMVNCSTG
jgi:hypothetical protein